MFFTFVILICGISFLYSKELSSQKFGFTSLKGAMAFLIFYYTMMLSIMAVVGIVIARNRKIRHFRVFLHGMFMFLFGCLVLFGEGVELLKFVNMDDADLESMC